ncbi:unnamed protein product [Candidula unifasciata]|uniref:DUF4515 domain-containing protein n=1 Tax=Candidula unifasciata TaxID=100452 RepID=A0A8S3ZYL7_9EUPU|nr:unnamed protein product [Candidula unifasciata]
MPPKKGKKGEKGGKKKGKADVIKEAAEPKALEPTEKEVLLKKELEAVTLQLEKAREAVTELRQEHEWLQNEAQKIRIESHEYMSFMERKTNKRQTTIITLNDHNKQEIRNLQLQRQNMEEEFNEKKKVLETLLLEKQHVLAKANKELKELQEYKELQKDQLEKIHDLEQQVIQLRAKHTERIQRMKADFLHEKHKYQQDSEFKIQTLERKANKEAMQCLAEHTNRIREENRELRQELLQLIKITRALNEHQRKLENQKRELLREQNYASNLKKLRETRQKKSIKSQEHLEEEVLNNSA